MLFNHLHPNRLAEIEKEVKNGVGYRKIVNDCIIWPYKQISQNSKEVRTKNYAKKGRLQEMALQVVANEWVKVGAVGIIDLMNKGLRLVYGIRRYCVTCYVGIIDLMNKGLRQPA